MTEPAQVGSGNERGKTAIYALLDPRTCRVRYIGKSTNPQKRMNAHCSRTITKRSAVSEWVRGLACEGEKPRMRIIRWVDDWETEERRLIAIGRKKRDLLNLENGGHSQKTSTKRLSKAFIKYRYVMARMAKWANDKERRGDIAGARETKNTIADVRRRVRELEALGEEFVESFYRAVTARQAR